MNDKTNTEARKSIRRKKGQRMAIGLNVIVAVLLAVLLAGLANVLSFKYFHYRVDWSRSKYYSLSDKTRRLLSSLTNAVNVVVFFQREQEIFTDLESLLKEYEYACDHLQVEYVDPDRDLARTELLAAKYDVQQANVVVFDNGVRSKYVTRDDVYDLSIDLEGGTTPKRVSFKGEQAFTSAIQSITQGRKPVVYFLSGHGEKDTGNFDKKEGYSGIAKHVRRDNVEVKPLVLGHAKQVPEDCSTLIIAGPEVKISNPELDLIRSYLDNNGRALVMLDAFLESGLEPILEKWGMHLYKDLVVDATRTLTGRELFITEYLPHPVTERLQNVTSIFYFPRSIEPVEMKGTNHVDVADKPNVVVLARSSESGWAETDLKQSPMKFDAELDRPGPIPVAVAVERGPVSGIDVLVRPTRLVVFGDSGFVSNQALTSGNIDLFMNALNWLLQREELMAIAPREIEEVRIILSENQLGWLFLFAVCLLPGSVALLGGVAWFMRRA